MDLVTGPMGSVTSKLGELLKDEYKLQKGLPDKIRCIIKELECAHAALRKVAGVPREQLEEQVRIWAREVREVSYEMEDVLDTFLVSALQGDPEQMDHQSLFECLKQKMAAVYNMVVTGPLKRRKIAVTVDDINNRLEAVTERHHRYTVHNFMSKPSPTSTIDPRLESIYKEARELVGIEKPSAELISMLCLSQGDEAWNKKMKTVSVVGTGGLGKTTLARAVYDKIKVEFHCWAFVPVGRHPDLKKVFRDILMELDKNYINSKITILDERQLINVIREYLRKKRYFIVVDDIWETKSWEAIKLALAVQDNCGSRLITTTRNLEVATHCGEVYNLKPLVYEKSRKLFYMRIFGAEGECPDIQLDELSVRMLKKCDGVPLAIITMASLLVGKSREEWIEVCRSILFREKKNSQQLNDTEWILSLSYYDLPLHLKTCLLYLSAFPEDYTIEKTSLIWKWVSEGFVEKVGSTGFFEVGEGYFNELINRSMIQPVQSETGLVHGCRVHDMVLDLLRLFSQEENFVTISNNDECMLSPYSRVRRLAHQNRILEPTHHHIERLGHLRSLITSSCYYKGLSLPSFRLLRVLALENCKVMTGCIPLNHLETLVHLRYLGLRGMGISKLPEGIGSLKLLQILDLKDTAVKLLPSSVGLLTQLICLRASDVRVPNGVIQKLTSLEELHIRSAEQQAVKELDKLSELLALNKAKNNGFPSEMIHPNFVESLRKDLKSWGNHDNAEKWGTGVLSRKLQRLYLPRPALNVLPACISSSDLPVLTHLDLNLRTIEGQYLQILGGLKELRHLKLNTDPNATTSTKVTVKSTSSDDCSFKKLRYCMLPNSIVQFELNEDSSVSLTMWNGTADVSFGSKKRDECRVAPAVLPNLEELIFWARVEHTVTDLNCTGDNLGLEYLPRLRKVRILFMTHNSDPEGRKKVKVALMRAIQVHPKKPTMEFNYFSARPM